MYRKNVAGQYLYFALVNATTGAALTGATVTGKRGIDGAAQASVTGTITEDAGGQYHLALSQADTNGNNIGYLFTATNAIPVSISIVTTAGDPTDAVRGGLTALPNVAAEAAGGLFTRGTGAGQINQPANGSVDVSLTTAGVDLILDRAAGVETGWTLRQAMRILLSVAAGKLSGAATTTVNIRDMADSKNRISATVDASGNRSAVTRDAT